MWVVQKTKKTKEYIFRARILIWPFYFNQDLCVMKAKAVESFKEVEICQKSIPIMYISISRLEILFFQSWKKNSLLPLNQWQMMCSLLSWKEILILWALKLVRAHFHFHIMYKFNNKIIYIINCLDSSVDRAMGSDSQG